MLLGLSLRYSQTKCRFHVLGYDLTAEDIKCLESIADTKVFPLDLSTTRSMCTQKPLAINTATTDRIVWMDSDCIVTGNVDKYLIASEGKMQIRFRGKTENASVYRNIYHKSDKYGAIPQSVLKIWQHDVADLTEPKISSVCQTNCFVITKEHIPFIQLWHRQMNQVLPSDASGVYLSDNLGYSMTDESVINSLFAYSSIAPQTTEYLMDQDPNAYCAHFGLQPKPWKHWTQQSFVYYEYVQALLSWANTHDIVLPTLPTSFLRVNRSYELLRSQCVYYYRAFRHTASNICRLILRFWR